MVDISVVNFRLDPRLSEKDALGFIDLCNAGLGSERLGMDLQVGFHGKRRNMAE